MKLLRGTQYLRCFDQGVVATIGNFDGVHLGHQALLTRLKIKAKQLALPLVVILFEPQPLEYFQKETSPARLSSLREKLDVLRKCQVDFVYCISFDDLMAQTEAVEFANQYLFHRLRVKYLLVGQDFRFGRNRSGDIELLKNLGQKTGCEVHQFSDFTVENEKISSTKIRTALYNGNLLLAAACLGRTYSLCGRVLHGDGRGRQWGIPTANLSFCRIKLPLHGVYVVKAKVACRNIYGVANLGVRPTIHGVKNTVEVHLFDFNDMIYGEWMQVFFLHKLRDEVKFVSIDALIAQIQKDIAAARAFISIHLGCVT